VHEQPWPERDEAAAADEVITLAAQFNERVRERLSVPVGLSAKDAQELALGSPKVQRHIAGKNVVKIVYVPDRLVNIVVE